MGLTVSVSVFAILIAVIIRYMFIKHPVEKPVASWICFGFAVLATMTCTLLSGGEPQGTLMSGFATMLVVYNVMCR